MFIERMNQDVRKAKGMIPNWVVARKIGIHENTLNRWMRNELSGDRKRAIMQAISDIKAEMERVAL